MSKFGIKNGGDIKAGNIQSDVVAITTDGSGNGSGTVTFKQAMPSTEYGVGFGFEESGSTRITTGVPCTADKTKNGFKLVVTGASAVSQGIKVGFTAIEAKSAY